MSLSFYCRQISTQIAAFHHLVGNQTGEVISGAGEFIVIKFT